MKKKLLYRKYLWIVLVILTTGFLFTIILKADFFEKAFTYIGLGDSLGNEETGITKENDEPAEGLFPKLGDNEDSLPRVFDWRDNGGYWMTRVVDGGSTPGVCWTHAVLGALEANYNIQVRKKPQYDFDLSDWHLYYCNDLKKEDSYKKAIQYLKDYGAVAETCSRTCFNDCPRYKVKDYYVLPFDRRVMKEALVNIGPLVVGFCMPWDEEFDSKEIGHCDTENISAPPGEKYNCQSHSAVIVGYNDYEQYWIIKNDIVSRPGGPFFLEDGYYKIGYGECFIDSIDDHGNGEAVAITAQEVSPKIERPE